MLVGHGLLWRALLPPTGLPAQRVAHRPTTQVLVRVLPVSRPELPLPLPVHAPPRRTVSAVAQAVTPAVAASVAAAAQQPSPPVEGPALAGAAELPAYATRLPDPVRLNYRLQHAVGAGRLRWQRDEAGYELRLDVEWPSQPAQGSSQPRIDRCRGRGAAAPCRTASRAPTAGVDFQRESARITFSGPRVSYALPPGAQDRLSWMLQLPAIFEANSGLARAGAVVSLFIAGTRGDAQAWRFEVLGHAALALHLRREPTRPFDSRVEVWLDPARQPLPLRAVFTLLPTRSAAGNGAGRPGRRP